MVSQNNRRLEKLAKSNPDPEHIMAYFNRITDLGLQNSSVVVATSSASFNQPEQKSAFKQELHDLDLQKMTSLGLLVQFLGCPASPPSKLWPNSDKNFCDGKLTIHFRNGMTQDIKLVGKLMRPSLELSMNGFEKCYDPQGQGNPMVVDFGLVHVDDNKILEIWLKNRT